MYANTTPTIYIVDDDPAVRDSLQFLISQAGMLVETFANADDFQKKYQSHEINCVLLDIRMPPTNGLVLQEQIREKGIAMPIIFITGHGDIEQCSRAFRGGAVDFLSKPINKTELLPAIHRAIKQSIQQQEQLAATQAAQEKLNCLSPREYEVLEKVVEGLSSKEIARLFELSPRTVETHRASLFTKLEVNSLAQLIRLYLKSINNAEMQT